MDAPALARRRLATLGLTAAGPGGPPRPSTAVDAVRRLLAVQSQDYGPGTWSIGQRLIEDDASPPRASRPTSRSGPGTAAALDAGFDAGAIIRTHVLRPTWHFVAPADLRWLLALTSPRVQARIAPTYRQLGLEAEVRARCASVIEAALAGGRHLTRPELAARLGAAGVAAQGQRLNLAVMHAELEGLICSGPRQGKQHTYALVAERVPPTAPGSREATLEGDPEAALAELARRYIAGHGPATVKDLAWWSSLPVADLRRGLERAEPRLDRIEFDGLDYWFAGADPTLERPRRPAVRLIQAYDEYVVGYTQSRFLMDLSGTAKARAQADSRSAGFALVLLDGQAVGWWRRTLARRSLLVEVTLDHPLAGAADAALAAEAARLAAFLELPLELRIEVVGGV